MLRTSRRINIRSGGRVWQVVREQYLRDDIACQSPLCFEGCAAGAGPTLPRHATCYLVPTDQVVRHFLDVLQLPEITGIVFTQTALGQVSGPAGKQVQRRVRNIIKTAEKESVFFANEFSSGAWTKQKSDETFAEWQLRLQYDAAVWYYRHLGGQVAVVVLCGDAGFAHRFGHRQPGVFVQTTDQYLAGFWPNLRAARDILDSVQAMLDSAGAESEGCGGSAGSTDYLPAAALQSGLSSGHMVRGHLTVNKHQPQMEAFVRSASAGARRDASLSDVLVQGAADRNRAVHGDEVVAGEPVPTGRVVGVLLRGWGEYVATLQLDEEQEGGGGGSSRAGWHLVVPFDRRVPKIRIQTRQADTLKTQRFVVRIDSWPVSSRYPQGHFVRVLGPIGDLETEIQVILTQNDISPRPFSQAVLSEMPSAADWSPLPAEVARRRDLRDTHLVFSVDPPGCEDVDDTMSVRRLPSGRLEVGVHIADVTQFVAAGSATDQEARRRGTTVYLADRRFDMLPAVLSGDLCSLLGGRDRYAVSVIWELDPDSFQVHGVWYGRSLIRSRYKMFYEAAQRLVDGTPPVRLVSDVPEWRGLDAETLQQRYRELRDALATLTRLTHHLRHGRQQEGALELESSEVQFEFDEGGANRIQPKQALEIHETVAEMMIFANHWVAQKIAQTFPQRALLRRHGAARPDQWEPLQRCAATKGWTVRVGSNRQVADSLDACVDPHDPLVNTLLRLLATRAMVNAEYFSTGSATPEDWGHYGLALDRYTHFTSPIRRYADVIVHRLLLAAVAAEGSIEQPAGGATEQFSDSELQEVADHLNDRNRAAQHCQMDSQVLFQTMYFVRRPADDPGNFVDAMIFSLRENGFLVHIPAYALRGPVYLQQKDGQVAWVGDEKVSWESESRVQWLNGDVIQNDSDVTVRTELGEQVYRLLDHVTVHIRVLESSAHAHQLRFDLITNEPYWASFREAALASAGDRSARQLVQEVTASQAARPAEQEQETPDELWSARGTSLYAVLQRHRQRSRDLKLAPATHRS
ncbi:DIS3-like exonuclease 1 [Pollicipes pollicipes]|uniref:DIS3-like exonuclease 1 n=1 Tax=Pollicipes pollicipes TaxID=41117 RepID=UPI0018851AE1|nr:DIS3-like exonuclease 1 [Pollicipes pollicipes]